ncbi:AAA family ATPase [Sphaerisporangium sp. B11E5]|uniref:MinD/ParA family ATP-binding protein n=1 Tax=Sphaerisporangium sp. B11E5 TaxID=3153563 RepID=UPI00325D76C9
MARHDREDPHSLEEQLAWLDAIKENEDDPLPVSVTAEEAAASPYPKDPWAHIPSEPPAPSSPLLRAAADTANSPQPAEPEPFSAPITSASEPLSRAGTDERPAAGERPAGGTFGERPSSGGGFGERPSPSGGPFGDRSSGAFGERPSTSGGAFGERGTQERPSGGAFGEPSRGLGAFADRPAPSGGGAFGSSGDSPGGPSSGSPGGGAFGEPSPQAAAEQAVSDDTDSFTFGSFEDPPVETGTNWLPPGPLTPGTDTGTHRPPEAQGTDQPVRGWLEAALPATRPGETRPDETRPLESPAEKPAPAEETAQVPDLDPEQERFNKFAAGGTDTEAVVVPREPLPGRAATRSERPADPFTAPPATSPPAAEPPKPAPAPQTAPQASPEPPVAPAAEAPAPAREKPSVHEEPPGEKEEREPYRPRRGRPAPAAPQPSFGTPARRGAAKTGVEPRPSADSLDPVSLLRGRRNAPAGGWRRLVFKASAGLIKPGESPEVRRRRELLTRARTPVATGHHRVAVLSLKGGVGKTTTTVGLGATLASVRGDRVIAVDANPDRGTLSDKVELETSATVRDLLNERQQIKRYVDIRAFTSQASSRLEILASDRDPSVSEAFSASDYQSVAQVLENFYSICITDCGTGLLHSAMSGVLGLADQLVLVSSPSVDGARAASATLDWLEAHHYGDLVKAATVVLCSVRPRSKSAIDLDKLEAHFAARCRAVIRVPYDPHLEEGAEIDLDRLQPATRESYLLLAASVGDGFGGASG